MSYPFEWNEFADQPHNVAPRRERFWHHLKHAGSYFALAASNLRAAVPVLWRYRRLRKNIFRIPLTVNRGFALSCSPAGEKDGEVIELLKETGVMATLVRIPSWERNKLDLYQRFIELLCREKIEVLIALLQRREDVVESSSWQGFCGDVFARLREMAAYFEIGHAWNRTKWGVWDYQEYLGLAGAAVSLAEKYGLKLVGPAVIDFEFHLYPPTLRAVPFDKVSSLLYVDRAGAPEKAQFGWTEAKKAALLRAVVDCSVHPDKAIWVTEVNWPLAGVGRYSPAAGKPCVSEESQANYLIRYFIIGLASGYIERIYWWQLAAPGYGLIDSREKVWRKRPSFFAFKNMVQRLEGTIFAGKVDDPAAEIFLFRRENRDFAVCWTKKGEAEHNFGRLVEQVISRDGRELRFTSEAIKIVESPKYVFFR